MIPSISPGLTLVNGTVGSGKTSLVWHVIMRELDRGGRVLTNIAFNPDLDERLEKVETFRDIIIPLEPRDDIFSDLDEVGQWNKNYTESELERPGLLRGGDGLDALIVVDEAQDWFAFPSSKCPPELVRVLNLIRKRGIRLILITPSAEDLAAAVRRKAIHRIVCEDLSTRPKIVSWLPAPPLFRWSRYRGAGTKAVESSVWFPNKAVLDTYASTGRTQGIEFEGSESDVVTSTERRKRAGIGLVAGSVVTGLLLAGGIAAGSWGLQWGTSRVMQLDEAERVPYVDGGAVPAYVRLPASAPPASPGGAPVEPEPAPWLPPSGAVRVGLDQSGRPIFRHGSLLLREGEPVDLNSIW